MIQPQPPQQRGQEASHERSRGTLKLQNLSAVIASRTYCFKALNQAL